MEFLHVLQNGTGVAPTLWVFYYFCTCNLAALVLGLMVFLNDRRGCKCQEQSCAAVKCVAKKYGLILLIAQLAGVEMLLWYFLQSSASMLAMRYVEELGPYYDAFSNVRPPQ